jgi:hypothetical protein
MCHPPFFFCLFNLQNTDFSRQSMAEGRSRVKIILVGVYKDQSGFKKELNKFFLKISEFFLAK